MKTFKLVLTLLFVFTSFLLKAQITVTADSSTIGQYNVLELTINHPVNYANNWDAVTINATFSGPQTIAVNGFYFDNNTWKVRFAPPQTGNWTYNISFITPDKGTYTAKGSFVCVPSDTKGFLKRHPTNPFRLVYADGSLFNGLAFEDCVYDFNGNGYPLDDFGFDGGHLTSTYTGTYIKLDPYMKAYGANGAGFNLYRWTTDNCSFRLWSSITTTGNAYNVNEGKWGDTLVRSLRSNNVRIWLTFFNHPILSNINGSTPLEDAALKKFINYVVARYGAYTDIWELFNESTASDYYVNLITNYVRSIDPYNRMISISDPQPKNPNIDIIAPHWYQKESELESDAVTTGRIIPLKIYNKPIMFGEQGNSVANWDTLSGLRMRIRSWTAFFSEGTLVFWNTSYGKTYNNDYAANIYLGPQERSYIKALHDYISLADPNVVSAPINTLNSGQVRGYGLRSSQIIMGYFHHYENHTSAVTTSFKYRLFRPGTIYWINPADNSVISTAALPYGDQVITSPPFTVDVAMRIAVDNSPYAFNENAKLDVILYPNPAESSVYINGNFNGTATVELYSVLGQKMFSQTNVANNQMLNFNLRPGVYIYKIYTDNNNRHTVGKLVVR